MTSQDLLSIKGMISKMRWGKGVFVGGEVGGGCLGRGLADKICSGYIIHVKTPYSRPAALLAVNIYLLLFACG